MRNIISHERFRFIEVKHDSIKIIKAFLNGLNIAKSNENYHKIDAELELLRLDNLAQMNQWLREINSKKKNSNISVSSFTQKIDSSILIHQQTIDLKKIKSGFIIAKNAFNDYRGVFFSQKKKTDLDNYKKTIINEIISEYYSVISELSPLSIIKKRNAKAIKNDFIKQIESVNYKEQIESIYELAIDSFDSL
jgi:hypothetical protein